MPPPLIHRHTLRPISVPNISNHSSSVCNKYRTPHQKRISSAYSHLPVSPLPHFTLKYLEKFHFSLSYIKMEVSLIYECKFHFLLAGEEGVHECDDSTNGNRSLHWRLRRRCSACGPNPCLRCRLSHLPSQCIYDFLFLLTLFIYTKINSCHIVTTTHLVP